MPPFHFRPPIEIFGTEILYFLIIAILCLITYFKTKDIYNLSKHKGIYHFRQIFLYFSLAYLFRLFLMWIMFSRELFFIVHPRSWNLLSMLIFSYFGTMAILSVVMTLIGKGVKLNILKLNIVLHLFALLSSLFVFATRSYLILILIQSLIFLLSIIFVMKGKHASIVSQNKITYILLFIFWILNVFTLTGRLLPGEFRIPLYLVSAAVFFSIFLRVQKRLSDVKKKG